MPRGFSSRLTDAELACGLAYGFDTDVEPVEISTASPRAELAETLATALAQPPCLISFSGGRDSSALLALAHQVAAERGFAPPIAATLVFPGDADADEESWQREVIDHLGVTEWERVVVEGDEVDAVGPIARQALSRHGLLWPFNTHLHVPILRLARGGTVITGFGGDELANASTSRRAARIHQRGPRNRDEALVLGLAMAPRRLRAAVISRRYRRGPQLPWLTTEGQQAVASMWGVDEAAEHWRWDQLLPKMFLQGRYFNICQASFAAIGSDHDATVVHPFVAPGVVLSLARTMGRTGAGSREQLMRTLFADLLPERTLARTTKATFTSPLWTETARSFAREWSGRSPAPGLVDPDRLRAAWLADDVDVRSTTLLQAAWLGDHSTAAPASAGRSGVPVSVGPTLPVGG